MVIRTWEQMRITIAGRLLRQTGHDIGWWNERISVEPGLHDEAALRRWLTGMGVTGYQQVLLTMERLRYPDYLLASADDLIEAQYRDRAQLRPILDAALAVAATFGPVDVQARKTYTTLMTPRRSFAAIRLTTKSRVDLVLRLDGTDPGGRLLDGRNTAGGGLNLRIALQSVDDLDDEAVEWFRLAYQAGR